MSNSGSKMLSYDLSSEIGSYYDWINLKSLEPFDQLDGGSYTIADLIKRPMFIIFLDRQSGKYGKQSIEVFDLISNKIALAYPEYIFMYNENPEMR